jgi:protein-cysteine N-palmitoyltransferase HHAT
VLTVLLLVHTVFRRVFTTIFPPKDDPSSRLSHRVSFDLLFASCFLIGVHGFNTLKIFIILALNYAIAKNLGGSKVLPAVTWIFNVGVLFLNEWYDGYRFAHIHAIAEPLVRLG